MTAQPLSSGRSPFPLATVALYGPSDELATKIVVAIFKDKHQEEPEALARWFSTVGDVRNDPFIAAQMMEFIKNHGVKQSVIGDRIIGCPHEEGVDYPLGEVCPNCPFWADAERFSHARRAPGRNEPCPCGSGKKFKKCCGA